MQKLPLSVVLFISALLSFAIIPTIYAIIVVSKSSSDLNTIAISNIIKIVFKDNNTVHNILKSKHVQQITK